MPFTTAIRPLISGLSPTLSKERSWIVENRRCEGDYLSLGKSFTGYIPSFAPFGISQSGACLQVQTTADIPAVFVFVQGGHSARTCQTIWRDDTQIGVKFIQRD